MADSFVGPWEDRYRPPIDRYVDQELARLYTATPNWLERDDKVKVTLNEYSTTVTEPTSAAFNLVPEVKTAKQTPAQSYQSYLSKHRAAIEKQIASWAGYGYGKNRLTLRVPAREVQGVMRLEAFGMRVEASDGVDEPKVVPS